MERTETNTALEKKNVNSAGIEQMCGILMLTMQQTADARLHHEFEGILKGLKTAAPARRLDVKRIDKYIITKLREIHVLITTPASRDKILAITADIGLLLLKRSYKTEKGSVKSTKNENE